MKKFFRLFLFYPQFLTFLAGYPLRDKKSLTCSLTTEYTFIRYIAKVGVKALSRTKVRHDSPAAIGFSGTQGEERPRNCFRNIR